MNHKRIYVFVAALVLIGTLPAHAIVFDFFQVDWMADPAAGIGPYVSQDSDWGRVEITLNSTTDHGLFVPMVLEDGTNGWGGFINIVTDAAGTGVDDWEIYNLPIFYEDPLELDGRLPQGVLFDLGVAPGVDIMNLNYGFTVDPTPLLTTGPVPIPSSIPAAVNTFEVLTGGDQLRLFGSLVESGGQSAPQPAQDFPGAESGEVIASRASIAVPETSVAGVNEDNNGCAPGSVARSIKYMADANSNVTVTDDANTVYGELKTAMGTTNKGTATSKILSGKDKYVSDNGLPIVSTQTDSFKEAMETLKNKGDVEIGMNWGTGADGKSKGAHRAFVSEIQELKDADGNTTGYVVKTVDDAEQGDGKATNKTHTAKFDANGKLVQYDGKGTANGAQLINFQTENVHASTVELDFWGMTATCHVSPGGYVELPFPFGEVKIPLGRPGESVSTGGGVKIRYLDTMSDGVPVASELVANPSGNPDPEQATLNMDIDVELNPEEPVSSLQIGLNLEHVSIPDDLVADLAPVVAGEGEVFLKNVIVGGSFFDVTYEINFDEEGRTGGEGYHVFRLHGEVAEEFLESIWLTGVEILPMNPEPDPDFHVDSFFDIFFDLEVTPEAYEGLFGPDILTPFRLDLTAVEVPEMIPGDANDDGIVDEEDAAVLASNWLKMENAYWTDGDFNNDGMVDDRDATIMAANWLATSLPEASVPEPAAIILLLAGSLCILCRSRRVRLDAPREC
jgi:hypothetical protein